MVSQRKTSLACFAPFCVADCTLFCCVLHSFFGPKMFNISSQVSIRAVFGHQCMGRWRFLVFCTKSLADVRVLYGPPTLFLLFSALIWHEYKGAPYLDMVSGHLAYQSRLSQSWTVERLTPNSVEISRTLWPMLDSHRTRSSSLARSLAPLRWPLFD